MIINAGMPELLLLLFFLAVPSTARTRGVQKKKIGQNHRELHGERITRGTERGGEGGRNKGLLEVVPMRSRADLNVPFQTEAPSAVPPTSPTDPSTPLPTDAITPAPVPPPTEIPTKPPIPDPTPPPTDTPTEAPIPDATPPPTEAPTAAPVPDPAPPPTDAPTEPPLPDPTPPPTEAPTAAPVPDPTTPPTEAPTQLTNAPTIPPTVLPTSAPTIATVAPTVGPPTNTPSAAPPIEPTFVMGRLNKVENGLTLSEGLSSRIIAKSLENLIYDSGELSDITFHRQPSGGDTFVDTRGNNPGGWAYLSSIDSPEGGAGLITFNGAGEVIKYEIVLEGTKANRNGGRTPWDTWISGERDIDDTQTTPEGDALQVSPFGGRDSEVLTLAEDGGAWAGFTYDIRDPEVPIFFMSENWVFGKVTRFIPDLVNTTDPWSSLHGPGTIEYLLLQPNDIDPTEGTFSWTNEKSLGSANAAQFYPEAQGIDINGNILAFVIQGQKQVFLLDLDSGVYKRTSTEAGLLEGEPNEIRYVTGRDDQTLLYMTEVNGQRSGVHARTDAGFLYTVFEGSGSYQPSTAGFALSPDGMHMYVSYPRDGLLFDITRDDGLSFFDPALGYEVAA